MMLTVQQLVSGVPFGLEHKVAFVNGAILMQSDYEQIGIGEVRRTVSNKAIVDANDTLKYATRLSGSGWMKPGLDGMNFKLPVRMGCIEPMCQQTSGGAITPVRTARSDIAAYAFAVTATGIVKTTLTGWTPAAVTGALYYLVNYYPILDGYARFSGGHDQASGKFNWTLDFQEK
jgi:hypothetical protein